MSQPSGNSGAYHNYTGSSNPSHPPPAQTLRTPSVSTGDGSDVDGSSDSGYASTPPEYRVPNTIVEDYSEDYSTQSYVTSRQPNQQNSTPTYSDMDKSSIEAVHTAPVSSSKLEKERRHNPPGPSSPSQYPCLHPNCGHISFRAHDLKRHMTVHFPPNDDPVLDCKYEWCGRTGAYGFKREDHRKEHYRKVHMNELEYPQAGKSGRNGRAFSAQQ